MLAGNQDDFLRIDSGGGQLVVRAGGDDDRAFVSTLTTTRFNAFGEDGDDDLSGVAARRDCDDANPAIHPGATDVPGNGVDEDCSGADMLAPATANPDTTPVPVATPIVAPATGSRGSRSAAGRPVCGAPQVCRSTRAHLRCPNGR